MSWPAASQMASVRVAWPIHAGREAGQHRQEHQASQTRHASSAGYCPIRKSRRLFGDDAPARLGEDPLRRPARQPDQRRTDEHGDQAR